MKMKKVLALGLATLTLAGISNPVFAQEQNNTDVSMNQIMFNKEVSSIENKLNDFIIDTLNSFAKENNLDVSFDNANFTIKQSTVRSIDNIEEAIMADIEKIKLSLIDTTTTVSLSDIQPLLDDRGDYYVAEVWSGAPSIGNGYIKTDFRAETSSKKVHSIDFLGDSYQTGFVYARWTPIRQWESISSTKEHVSIHMKGVLNYTFDIMEGGMEATFREDLRVNSSGKLIEV